MATKKIRQSEELGLFGLMQALQSRLYELLTTKGRDGFPGKFREIANAAAYDAYEAGSDRVVVHYNGFPIGAIRVNTKRLWRVADSVAYQLWCQENHHMTDELRIKWEDMTPEEIDQVASFIWDNFDDVRREELVWEPYEPVDPTTLDLAWNEEQGKAYDRETGEEVPGVEMVTEKLGTTLEGFKLDGSKNGPGKKYVAVRKAMEGIPPAKQLAMLMGGIDDDE